MRARTRARAKRLQAWRRPGMGWDGLLTPRHFCRRRFGRAWRQEGHCRPGPRSSCPGREPVSPCAFDAWVSLTGGSAAVPSFRRRSEMESTAAGVGGADCCEAEAGGSWTGAGTWTVTGDVVLGATVRFKRGLIAGRDVDIGEIEFLIGPVEHGNDIGGGGFFRQGWNDVFRGRLTRRPEDDLGHGNELGQRDGFEKVGLDEGLRAQRGLGGGTRKMRRRVGAARGSRCAGMRVGVGNARGCSSALLSRRAQIELTNREVIGDDSGDRWSVANAEPDDRRGEGVDEDGAEEGCRPMTLRRLGQEERDVAGRHHQHRSNAHGILRGRVKLRGMGVQPILKALPCRQVRICPV